MLDPQPPRAARIIGGGLSDTGLASSMACVVNKNGSYTTGVILSSEYVAFAASFEVDKRGEVYLGMDRVPNTDTGTGTPIKAVSRHRDYDEALDNRDLFNLAYLKLATPAPSTVIPVKVNTNLDYPTQDAFVRLVGYGTTSDSGSSNPDRVLNQADVPLYSIADCVSENGLPDSWSNEEERIFCAGYVSGGCSTW